MQIMRPSQFNDLSIIQLLQNIDDYNHVLRFEPYLYCCYTLETYKKWCIDRLFSRWLKHFSDLVRVLERNYERDPFFKPRYFHHERRFYNLLLHYGKKIKDHTKKSYFICILFSSLI